MHFHFSYCFESAVSGIFLALSGIPATYDLPGLSSGTMTDSVNVFDHQNASDMEASVARRFEPSG
jgi:hypothetical protein